MVSRQINNQFNKKQIEKQIILQSRIQVLSKHLPNNLGLLYRQIDIQIDILTKQDCRFSQSIYQTTWVSYIDRQIHRQIDRQIYLQSRIVGPLKAFTKQFGSLIQIDRYIYRQIDILTEQDCRFSQSIYQTTSSWFFFQPPVIKHLMYKVGIKIR